MSGVIDLGALSTVAAIALVGGVGVVGSFSLGLVSATEAAERRRGTVVYGLMAVLCLAVCAAVIVLGVWTLLDK